jgi:hypothetical protein
MFKKIWMAGAVVLALSSVSAFAAERNDNHNRDERSGFVQTDHKVNAVAPRGGFVQAPRNGFVETPRFVKTTPVLRNKREFRVPERQVVMTPHYVRADVCR